MKTIRIAKTTIQILATAVAAVFLLSPAPISAKELSDTLAKNRIGESLKEFKRRYPRATCGRLDGYRELRPENLVQTANMDKVVCCLNDRNSLAEISKLPITSLDECAVYAKFWKGRLNHLSYRLDTDDIQSVLISFQKLYGPPTQIHWDPRDASKPRIVSWIRGETNLDLYMSQLEPYYKHSGSARGEMVSVGLWNLDFDDHSSW